MSFSTRDHNPLILLVILIIIMLIPFLSATFSKSTVEVSLEYDGSVEPYLLKSTYWGIKKEKFEIKFFPESSIYVEGWHVKNEAGNWVYLMLHDDYDWPDNNDRY